MVRVLRHVSVVLVASLLFLSATAEAGIISFYGGDFDGANGLSSEVSTSIADSYVFEDFTVPAGGWVVDAVFGNFLMNFVPATAEFQIRSGVSSGVGGALLAGGTLAATRTPTGRSGFGYTEYQVRISGLSIALAPGTYWLAVSPVGTGSGRAFVSTTSGLNSIGSPINNDNNFFTSTTFGAFYSPVSTVIAASDFSLAVEITAVPEPATFGLFGLGVGALGLAARRRRRVAGHRNE